MAVDRFVLKGGLDVVTPNIAIHPGSAIACSNYEAGPKGYQRIQGFERFDGRPAPSDATYHGLTITGLKQPVANAKAGVVVTREHGLVVGTLLLDAQQTGEGDALETTLILYGAVPEAITVGMEIRLRGQPGTFAVVATAPVKHSQPDQSLHDAWLALATTRTREAIAQKPPGSGPVRGIFGHRGRVYCIRDDAQATKSIVHYGTPTGWKALPEYFELPFKAGLAALGTVKPGDTLTSSNGATGRVLRVVVESGAFSNNDAQGRLILSSINQPSLDKTRTVRPLPESQPVASNGQPVDRIVPLNAFPPAALAVGNDSSYGLATDGKTLWDASSIEGRLVAYNVYTGQRDIEKDIDLKLPSGSWAVKDIAYANNKILAILNRQTPPYVGYIRRYDLRFGYELEKQLINSYGVMRNSFYGVAHDPRAIWVREPGGTPANNTNFATYDINFNLSNRFYLPKLSEPGSITTMGDYIVYWNRRNGNTLRFYNPNNGDNYLSIVNLTFATQSIVQGICMHKDIIWLNVTQLIERGKSRRREIRAFRHGALFNTNETLTLGNTPVMTVAGFQQRIELAAGKGQYTFDTASFSAQSDSTRVYGANGAQRAWEFGYPHYDAEQPPILTPINSAMDDDRPTTVVEHKNHLFLGFENGRVMHSSIGDPMKYTVTTGAAELGVKSPVTGLIRAMGDVLIIFGRRNIHALHGSSAADWILKQISENSGAQAHTAQSGKMPIYYDDWGLRAVASTDRFGDFSVADISTLVEPIFALKRRQGVSPVASQYLVNTDMYRAFWEDGTGVSVYFGGKGPAILLFNLGMRVFTVNTLVDDKTHATREFLGAEDGRVIELGRGNSFDGQAIKSFLRLPFNGSRRHYQNKVYHKAGIKTDSAKGGDMGISVEFDYGSGEPQSAQDRAFLGSGGYWDQSFWDNFSWSSPVEGEASAYIDGFGANASIALGSDAIGAAHVLTNAYLYYTLRGMKK